MTTRVAFGVAFAVCGLLAAADAAFADVCVWTAAGTDTRWSVGGNWSCGRSPGTGDVVSFIGGLSQQASSDNDISGLVLARLVINGNTSADPFFRGTRWEITGFGVTVTELLGSEVLSDNLGRAPSLQLPITFGAAATIRTDRAPSSGSSDPFRIASINLNDSALTFDVSYPIVVTGAIEGNGSVAKTGPESLRLNDNSYIGSTRVSGGTLIVTGPHSMGATGPQNETIVTGGTLLLDGSMTLDQKLTLGGVGADNVIATLATKPGIVATLNGPVSMPLSAALSVAVGSRLSIAGAIAGAAAEVLHKQGAGTLVLLNPANAWDRLSIDDGTVLNGAVGAIPARLAVVLSTTECALDLNNLNATIGQLEGAGQIRLGTATLTINIPANIFLFTGTIDGSGGVVKTGAGSIAFTGPDSNSYTGTTTVQAGTLAILMQNGAHAVAAGTVIVNGGRLEEQGTLIPCGNGLCPALVDNIVDTVPVIINAPGQWELQANTRETIASLAGTGDIVEVGGQNALRIGASNASTTFGGALNVANWTKIGSGTLTLTGSTSRSQLAQIEAGALLVNGTLSGGVSLSAGTTLAGSGTILEDIASQGIVTPGAGTPGAGSPGVGPGILRARAASLTSGTFVVELNGPTAGTGYDQLALIGDLTIGLSTRLQVTSRFGPRAGTQFTIAALGPGRVVTGTFAGLAEGASFTVDQQQFGISYHGGDGNDVVLTALGDAPAPPAPPAPSVITYYLSEGATGGFFDEDVLIGNPNDTDAPVTLTFSKENGEQVVATRSVPPQSHITVHVDKIPGLEQTAASAQVRSESGVPLLVERSMFWDSTYYAGHTGSAVDQPGPDWFFAEGSQGFFDTFVLVINPNATPTDVTFTFFRENDDPVVKTITVGAATRLTLPAGDVPELVNRSFGIAVHATQPIMAERAMYFGTTPERVWSGGHESAGVTAASTHWFLAEGATGGFFDTFILLNNPQSTPATVTLQYLLDTGETVTVPKTIAANTRLTTNIEAEDDVRLHNAALSTVVTSDVPIIAERSMYWPGAADPWGEGHNSFGVVDAGTTWGLGEGRRGGPLKFHTYILLANPQTTAAEVTVRILREAGAPIIKTYTVKATSRFNIDTSELSELHDEYFGAVIQVTNGVPIIVERSMYWDSNGFEFSGGTNATGIRLP